MTSSPLRLPAFTSGNGSLIPFDSSDIFVRFIVVAIRSLPILCWVYLGTYLLIPSPLLITSLPKALQGKWLRLAAKYVGLPWSIVEVVFSIYHAYLVRKVQGPGPKPLYSRRFLHKVFARALRSGLGLDHLVKADRLESQRVERLLTEDSSNHTTTTSTLRARKAVANGNGHGNGSGTHVATGHHDGPDGNDPEPWFSANTLSPEDPRARKFQREQAQWFHLSEEAKPDSTKMVTRRDVSQWLAWSLFNTTLDHLEEEHHEMVRRTEAGQDTQQLLSGYHVHHDEAGAREADEEDPDLRKVLAEVGEWSRVQEGTRLDFIRKARRLLEARQGFRYPLTRGGPPGPERELDCEGGQHGSLLTGSMRLTLDPVAVEARPFIVYCVTQGLSRLSVHSATHSRGFKLQSSGRLSYLVRIPPSWSPSKADDPSTRGKYRPTIFLHGLGIGLAQYHALIAELSSSEMAKTHPIMIPIQPHISQDIFSPHFLKPVGHHEMITCLRKAMRSLEWNGSIQVLSHSMGTIVHAWLLKSLGSRIARSCFVDPIPFRLFIPDVCGNFLYFKADTPIKRLLRFFVGREIGTANALSRYFDWSSNILWPEDEIPNISSPHHTRFFLAGQDVILNCRETRAYLLEYGVREEVFDKDGKRTRGGMVVDWGAAHGELLMKDGAGMREILRWLDEEDEIELEDQDQVEK